MEKMETIAFGAIFGFLLKFFYDRWQLGNQKQKDIEYLAIQVACLLERFIIGCFDIISDDGLYYGQTDENGRRTIQNPTPDFEPEKLDEFLFLSVELICSYMWN